MGRAAPALALPKTAWPKGNAGEEDAGGDMDGGTGGSGAKRVDADASGDPAICVDAGGRGVRKGLTGSVAARARAGGDADRGAGENGSPGRGMALGGLKSAGTGNGGGGRTSATTGRSGKWRGVTDTRPGSAKRCAGKGGWAASAESRAGSKMDILLGSPGLDPWAAGTVAVSGLGAALPVPAPR